MEQVTQADREAAANAICGEHPRLGEDSGYVGQVIEMGICDEHNIVQAFARHRIEATQAKDEEIARYRAALEAILNEETVSVHVGYDSGSGGGNFVYADAVRTDSEAFEQARALMAEKSRG